MWLTNECSIYVSQKRCAVVNCEASYEDDAELERASYRNTVIILRKR